MERGQKGERKKLNEPRNIRLCGATALYNLKGTSHMKYNVSGTPGGLYNIADLGLDLPSKDPFLVMVEFPAFCSSSLSTLP